MPCLHNYLKIFSWKVENNNISSLMLSTECINQYPLQIFISSHYSLCNKSSFRQCTNCIEYWHLHLEYMILTSVNLFCIISGKTRSIKVGSLSLLFMHYLWMSIKISLFTRYHNYYGSCPLLRTILSAIIRN